MRRVVITGIGIVSPLGLTRETTWQRVVAGERAAGPITSFDASGWRTNFLCEVRGFKLEPEAAPAGHALHINRATAFGLQAALEAMTDSGVVGHVDADRLGVSVGVGIGSVDPSELTRMMKGIDVANAIQDLARQLEQQQDKDLVLKNHPATMAHLLSYRWRALGPQSTINTACASSGQAIGQALHGIRRGDADVMLAGGADSLAGVLYLAAFCLLGAVSVRNDDPKAASRPFDKGRDGFVASEGAAMVVLEEREHALQRGATIYGELLGYGDTGNAYRVTDLPEDGSGIILAMEEAARDGGVDLGKIDYINAHGTSTPLNDRIEAMAIDKVFTSRGFSPLVSSTKSSIGHLISAAGGVELAFCALSVRDQIAPPTCNLDVTDCSQTVNFVAKEAKPHRIRCALSNLLGFGGSNATLVVGDAGGDHGVV